MMNEGKNVIFMWTDDLDNKVYEGETSEEIIFQIKKGDWAAPHDILEFKENVTKRVEVMGYSLLYFDATSFLMALVSAGLAVVGFVDTQAIPVDLI